MNALEAGDAVFDDATVLVIDDSESNRFALRRWLERAGADVVEAATASEGLEAVAALPDVVVIDVRLPDMSGLDVTASIKRNPLTQNIPVVQRSSVAIDLADRINGLDAGADAYLVEPIERALLLSTVASQLRRRDQSRTLELALSLEVTGVYDWAVPTGTVRWSDSLERMHGFGVGEFGGSLEDFVETVHEGDRGRVVEELASALVDRDHLLVDFRFLRQDGSIGWMESHGRIFRDGLGVPMRVLGLCHDVTRQTAERQRVEQLRAIASALGTARQPDAVMSALERELDGTGLEAVVSARGAGVPAQRLASAGAGEERVDIVMIGAKPTASADQARAIAELAATALERARLFEVEQTNAEALQRALLDHRLPCVPGWKLDAHYAPAGVANRLGGDFFDALVVGDRLVVAVGDVAGHGLEATQSMGVARVLLRTLAAANDGDPVAIVSEARRLVPTVLAADAGFVTALVATVHPDGRIECVSAGHTPPIVVGGDGVSLLRMPAGPPLGVPAARRDRAVDIVIGEADWLAFVTDGVLERRSMSLDESLDLVADRIREATTAVDVIAAAAVGSGRTADDRVAVRLERAGGSG